MNAKNEETIGVLTGLGGGMTLAMFLLVGMTGGGFFLILIVLAMLPVMLFVLAADAMFTHEAIPALQSLPIEASESLTQSAASPPRRRAAPPLFVGAAAGMALFAAYVGLMTLWEGWGHTLFHLSREGLFVLAVVAGVGFFAATAAQAAEAEALRGAVFMAGLVGTGLSAAGLFACCAPLLVRFFAPELVLPAAILALQFSMMAIAGGLAVSLIATVSMGRAILAEGGSR